MAKENRTREYAEGERVFTEGDPGNEMYYVEQGRVEIRHRVGDKDEVLARLQPGQFFGEMAIFDADPRSATAIAARASRLVCYTRDEFEAAIREDPELASFLIEDLCTRLRKADQYVRDILESAGRQQTDWFQTASELRAIMQTRIKPGS